MILAVAAGIAALSILKPCDLPQAPMPCIFKSHSVSFGASSLWQTDTAPIVIIAGVATGAIVGHAIATAIAVIGGAIISNYISEKTVGYIGGSLFLVFAVATAFGAF